MFKLEKNTKPNANAQSKSFFSETIFYWLQLIEKPHTHLTHRKKLRIKRDRFVHQLVFDFNSIKTNHHKNKGKALIYIHIRDHSQIP